MRRLVELQYRRNEASFHRGTFRMRGDTIDLYPAHLEDQAWRISLFGDEVEAIHEFDPLTGERTGELASIRIYPNSHYVTPKPTLIQAMKTIKAELGPRLAQLTAEGKLLEAQRLEQRTTFDLEMMETTGACRSEEHTSELQSLMRISYAVFCLKQKITHLNIMSNHKNKPNNK